MIKKIPKFHKVLFCLPLRGGLIALVYFNIFVSAAACAGFGFLDVIKAITRMFTMRRSEQMHRVYRSKVHPTFMFLALLIYIVSELGMTVVALVGIHKSKPILVKHYLYYSVGSTVFILFTRMFDVNQFYWYFDVLVVLTYTLIKLYHILCVRSFLKSSEGLLETKPECDVEMESAFDNHCEHGEITKSERQNLDDFNDIIS